MTEADVIHRTGQTPQTVDTMAADLRKLGLPTGATVVVHSSLSALGWVCGGAVAVVQALEQALTADGTLVMPTHSSHLSDPAEWENPPVPESWWQVIRDTTPAFDPGMTPTRGMGAIPECFRGQAGVMRSRHPQYSFAALGPNAGKIVNDHPYNFSLGDDSPLAKIYELGGWILLLGVDHSSNTSLHLAEYRADYPAKKTIFSGTSMIDNGERKWVRLQDIILETEDFTRIGAEFEQETKQCRQGKVGLATAKLMPQRDLVDFAVTWMTKNRG
jgi:aminoglycoside 3-N-acetyltransferase